MTPHIHPFHLTLESHNTTHTFPISLTPHLDPIQHKQQPCSSLPSSSLPSPPWCPHSQLPAPRATFSAAGSLITPASTPLLSARVPSRLRAQVSSSMDASATSGRKPSMATALRTRRSWVRRRRVTTVSWLSTVRLWLLSWAELVRGYRAAAEFDAR
ncbi:hypothetical protein BDV96DRAFT_281106 [Lophiotrema nucula]|uniref:Uncharacterized protein n=1 Tax=Lophiotrema nucula TaxID=690887 RepID=A0A6A5ZMU0_9PLEO|nr:hypothetical protein BDV96DRAFT_281106 [Lophiotrema nucula]